MARIEEQEYTQRIATYIRDLRGIKLEINGDDVVKLGMKQGPEIRELLDDVLKARLDGKAATREEQLKLASTISGSLR
jgi:tRNA nucleotidyltransferase (CCA-adding enzyme)